MIRAACIPPANRRGLPSAAVTVPRRCALVVLLVSLAGLLLAGPAGAFSKEDVTITAIEPVGNYAVKLVFSDGHDTGLYSWDYLYDLGRDYEALWLEYLGKLSAAGVKRK